MSSLAIKLLPSDEPARSLADTIAARRKALTSAEVANFLGLARSTVYDMARDGRIPSIRIGSAIRHDPKHIADWLRKLECSNLPT